jgi:hypothetical protein
METQRADGMLGFYPKTFGTTRRPSCQLYSPVVFTPKEVPWYSFILEAEWIIASKDPTGNRTLDSPSCGLLPQPTASLIERVAFWFNIWEVRGSHFGPKTAIVTEGFYGFSQTLKKLPAVKCRLRWWHICDQKVARNFCEWQISYLIVENRAKKRNQEVMVRLCLA